jgi:hypothetical protein
MGIGNLIIIAVVISLLDDLKEKHINKTLERSTNDSL